MIYPHKFPRGTWRGSIVWFRTGSSQHTSFLTSSRHKIFIYKNCGRLSINHGFNLVRIRKTFNKNESIIPIQCAKFWSSFQVVLNLFQNCPIFNWMCRYESSKNTNYIGNIWMSDSKVIPLSNQPLVPLGFFKGVDIFYLNMYVGSHWSNAWFDCHLFSSCK